MTLETAKLNALFFLGTVFLNKQTILVILFWKYLWLKYANRNIPTYNIAQPVLICFWQGENIVSLMSVTHKKAPFMKSFLLVKINFNTRDVTIVFKIHRTIASATWKMKTQVGGVICRRHICPVQYILNTLGWNFLTKKNSLYTQVKKWVSPVMFNGHVK